MDEVLIHFRLMGPEAKALKKWASDQSRKPSDQVRHVIRRELGRLAGVREAPHGNCASSPRATREPKRGGYDAAASS